ncbi:MAG: SEL1-like repeat protein [Chlorobiaceae bacterium]|nr:SEL1-like repeat protein [Chlorobiaceae bacterium]
MAEAQFNLGNAYSKGEGVKLNKATAKAWYQKACANGSQPACDVLKKKK